MTAHTIYRAHHYERAILAARLRSILRRETRREIVEATRPTVDVVAILHDPTVVRVAGDWR